MCLGCGAGIYIKRYTQLLKRVLDYLVVAVNDILWSHTLAACLYSDRHTVLVASAYHHNVLSAQAQITGVNVGRYINTGEMSDMNRTIGIWKSRSNQCAFKFLLHRVIIFMCAKLAISRLKNKCKPPPHRILRQSIHVVPMTKLLYLKNIDKNESCRCIPGIHRHDYGLDSVCGITSWLPSLL